MKLPAAGVFPVHEVRLSQATEVRRQKRKDAAIEMKGQCAVLTVC